MSNSFEKAKAEHDADFAESQAHTRKVMTGLAIFAGIALVMCCGFATFLVIRLT